MSGSDRNAVLEGAAYYNNLMRECQNRVFKTAQKKITSHLITPPDVIYHYTDAKGLCGIIESECIWATHSGFLNDARELTYSFDVMRNFIARNNSLEELRQHFLAKISEHIDTTEAYSPFAYVVCFCTDSNLLSQWRGYGSMGNGVAIGFRTAALTKLMNQNEFLKKCIYDEYIHEQFFASCIDAAYQCFKSSWKKASQQQKQDTLEADTTPLALIRSVAPMTETEARNFLHYFLFAGDDVFLTVEKLSYGERSRLLLAKLIAEGANCLILDEPINHLDIPSRERFEEALNAFPGAILVAIHDRAFIDRFATAVWSIEDATIRHYQDRQQMLRGKRVTFEVIRNG